MERRPFDLRHFPDVGGRSAARLWMQDSGADGVVKAQTREKRAAVRALRKSRKAVGECGQKESGGIVDTAARKG